MKHVVDPDLYARVNALSGLDSETGIRADQNQTDSVHDSLTIGKTRIS